MTKISIHVGVFNSAAAYRLPNGEIILLQANHGTTFQEKVIPSFLKFYANGKLEKYGIPAYNELPLDPCHVVWGLKRLLGKSYKNAKDEFFRFKYLIKEADDGSIIIPIGAKIYTPHELITMFLRKIKEDCESSAYNPIGSNINRAIITYPAYFDCGQIASFENAVQKVGFEEVGLISETMAAALAYRNFIDFSKKPLMMVIDWGAMTLDIVMERFSLDKNGDVIAEVALHYGDSKLGGMDIDDALIKKAKELYGLSELDPVTEGKLRLEIEKKKIKLSSAPWTMGFFSIGDKPYSFYFARTTKDIPEEKDPAEWLILEDTLADVLQKFRDNLFYSLDKYGFSPDMIDGVILIGGPMHMPCVRKAIENVFKNNENVLKQLEVIEKETFPVNPLEAVVRGAIMKDFITLDPGTILPYTYGFLLDGLLIKDCTILENTIITGDRIIREGEELFCRAGHSMNISLYKKVGTKEGEKHYKKGDYKFTSVAPQSGGSPTYKPIIEIDHNHICTLKIIDTHTQNPAAILIFKDENEELISPPLLLLQQKYLIEYNQMILQGEKRRESVMNKELLRAGFYHDALKIPSKASKKDILFRIMDLITEYSDDQEILDLLKKAQDYLIGQEKKYRERILPCFDYILILITRKYGTDIKDEIVSHNFLKIETIEREFEKYNEREKKDPFEDVPNEILESYFQKRIDSLDLNYEADKIDYIEAVLQFPEDQDYAYFDGTCDNSTPLRKRALKLAMEIYQKLPQDPSLLGKLGFSFLQFGDYQRALTCFLCQSEKSEEDGIISNNIAWCQMRLGDYEKALVTEKIALKYLPDNSLVYHDYAAILMGLGLYDEAIKVIKNVISNIKPEAPQLSYLLSSIFEKKDNVQSSVFYWKHFMRLASGKKGHEKAVLRVQEKLKKIGRSFSDIYESSPEKRVPLRNISNNIFNEIIRNIQETIKILKKHNIKFNEILSEEELMQKLKSFKQKRETLEKQIDEIEPRCKDIFEEVFKIIRSLPFLTFNDEFYNELIREHQENNLPFYVIVRDVVLRTIGDIIDNDLIESIGGLNINVLNELMKKYLENISRLKTLKSEIKPRIDTIENTIEKGKRLNKLTEFYGEIRHTRINLEVDKIKWLASISESIKSRDKNISTVFHTYYKALNEYKRLFTKETIEKYTNNVPDHSVLSIEEFLTKLQEKSEVFEKEYTLNKQNARKLEENCLKIEQKKKNTENELKKKIKVLEQEKGIISKILNLLQSSEEIVNSVAYIKKFGGITGWILGRRKIAKEIISTHEKTLFSINTLRPGFINKRNLSQGSIDKTIEIIRSEVNKEFQQAKKELKLDNYALDKKKDKVSKELKAVISGCANSKDKLIKEKEGIDREIKKLDKGKKDIKDLINDSNKFKNKWPIYRIFKDEDIVHVSSFISNGGENIIYAGLKKGDISICDLKSGANYTLSAHTKGITSIVADSEKNFLITAGYDGQIILWDFEKKEVLKTFNTEEEILSLSLLDSLLFAGGNKAIWVYELPNLSLKACLEGHEGKVICLALDKKNSILYSGEGHSEDPLFSEIYVWDIKKLSEKKPLITRLGGLGGWVTSLALSPKGNILVSGEGIGHPSSPKPSKIILWDTNKLKMKTVLEAHEGWVESLTFSEDEKWLISGDGVGDLGNPQSSDILIWDIDKGELNLRIKAHSGWVRSLSFNNHNNFLISGGTEGVFLWDFERVELLLWDSENVKKYQDL